mmetsp:Transcript_88711/g.206454  ORF Transcript_88711/g.206454 Transcript_88711/m.206454 type:complete len:165 (+) Transcript_88711:534-1028(+)
MYERDCAQQRCAAGEAWGKVICHGPKPDEDGDCRSPGRRICRTESSYCPPSQSNRDREFFLDTCDDCMCRAVCNYYAAESFANENDDCLCAEGTACYRGSAKEAGCPVSSGDTGYQHFAATCSDCVCRPEDKERPPPTCQRNACNEFQEPDSLGDCLCDSRTPA